MTACPPDLLHRESIKEGGRERETGGGNGGPSDCTRGGVTYEVTQNGFWTVCEADEKVAFASLSPAFSVTAAISGQK